MLGIFICFVLPGILAGLLLSQGSRAVARKSKDRRRTRKSSVACAPAQPDKSRLFVYDLRQDYSGHKAA